MANTILQAVVSYLNDNQHSLLTKVDVVIFLPGMVQEFINSMQKSVEKKGSLWSRFQISISDWFTGGFATAMGKDT